MKLIQIFTLIALVLFVSNCSKDKDSEDEINPCINSDSIMIDILTESSGNENSILDIQPIPIPQELINYGQFDTAFHLALDAIEGFNDFIENPGMLLGQSLKSTQSSDWDFLGCEEMGSMSECSWEQDHGDYKYTAVQTITFAGTYFETYISGTYDGIDYGDSYLISDWATIYNDLQFMSNVYFAPTHEGVKGEPVFSYLYAVGEGCTVYTPGGGSQYIMNSLLQNVIYTWDGIDGHHESISTLMNWEGNVLTTLVETWCPSYHSIKPFYASTYDFAEVLF